jgi:hypothetical protein
MAERRKIYGLEDPTYDWLVEKHMALYDALQADGGNPPSVVAKVIADAVEDGSRRLRYPGAADAKRMTDAHRQNDDVAYLDHMAAELGLDW